MQLKAVIFDWAGTTVDHGSLAPVRALQELFGQYGVELADGDARLHMGLLKRDHIEKTLAIPRVQAAWSALHGTPDDAVVTKLYAEFLPVQMRAIERFSEVIAGVPETVERLRRRGLRIGSTTGYSRPMLDRVLAQAREQGFEPDLAVSPDEVGGGRPHPWMCYLNAIHLKTYPLALMVKAGDTESDIAEGRNAGMWTVGVVRTGNLIGLSDADWRVLEPVEREARLAAGRERMRAAGANHVVDSVADLDAVLDHIERDLDLGWRP